MATTPPGNGDAFVAKLVWNGSTLALGYSTFLGGSAGDERTNGIAVDSSGNAYITGFTSSSNFPATSGAYQTTLAGGLDAFIAKLNPTGSALVYATYLGGSYDEDIAYGIAVDATGSAYVVGTTYAADFPATSGAPQPSKVLDICSWPSSPCSDAFIAKLNPSGSALAYSTFLGGTGSDTGLAIAVDAWGRATVTGYTRANDSRPPPMRRNAPAAAALMMRSSASSMPAVHTGSAAATWAAAVTIKVLAWR